jgi:ribosomal protein S6--L-glutamate ligase
MRILILSRKSTIYSTRRLMEAAQTRGHEVSVVDPLEISYRIAGMRWAD